MALGWAFLPGVARAATPQLLSTRDGLHLAVNPNGTVQRITIGGRRLPPSGAPGGFSLRLAGGTPNLVRNAGFESDRDGNGTPDGWSLQRGVRLDASVARRGRRSLRIRNAVRGTSGSFRTEVAVQPSTHYVFSCWFRSRGIQPTSTTADTPSQRSPLRVLVYLLSASGVQDIKVLYGYTDTADWNRQFLGFLTRPDTTRVRIEGEIRDGSGTAWFDEFYLGELLQRRSRRLSGRFTRATDGSRALHQVARLRDPGLTLRATYRPGRNHLRVDGEIESTSRRDIPFQITYTIPVAVPGWRWADYARSGRTILKGESYGYETAWNAQPMSRYPYATIHGSRQALAMGIPLDQPRAFRIRYTPQGLAITFDLGVTRSTRRLGPRASFSFVIYAHSPGWGFRAATRKYYDIFPEFFVRRTDPAREGIWYRTVPLGPLEGMADDFGLGLNLFPLGNFNDGTESLLGLRYLPWNNGRGVYSSAYTHQWVIKVPYSGPRTPTYEEGLAMLQSAAALEPANYREEVARDLARAALVSTARDYNGRLLYERYKGRWLEYYQVLDPQPGAAIDAPGVAMRHQVEHALDLAAGYRLDGIHLDSTSGMRRWGDSDNYARSLWANAGIPLTFSYQSGRVAQRLVFPIYEHIRRVADFVHSRGMILSANFNGSEARSASFFGADCIDYFGIERGLPEKTGGQDPFITIDSLAMQKRTLAFQRPLSTLDPLEGAGALPPEETERRLQRNLFYGIFAGIGLNKTWSEAQRALYARYSPLFALLARAGWEPIPNARSSNPEVWVERFGSLSAGTLCLTLRNETALPQTSVLTVYLTRDGLRQVARVRVRDLVAGRGYAAPSDGRRTRVRVSLAPQSTLLLTVEVR